MNFFRIILISFLIFAPGFCTIAQVTSMDNLIDDSKITIDSIVLIGNKITKDRIILRELEFKNGSKLTAYMLDSLVTKSQQNLMNRSLFNFVTISKKIEGNNCIIIVSVTERWYIWPIPIIQFADRNINSWLEKEDLSRINYGVDLRIDNFRGLMENLNIVLQGGYDILLAFRWNIPYLSKNQVFGMGLAGGVQLNHEVAYQTIDNKEQFYYSENGFAQQLRYGNANFTFRPEYNYLYAFNVGYTQYIFKDTILKLNPEFASTQTTYNYFTLGIGVKLDFRDYKPYPLNGYYFDISINKKGLGVFNDDVDYLAVGTNFDQYIHLYNKFYFAYNFGAKFTNQNKQSPYFIKMGLGYHPFTIRGYELYVVNGQKIGIFKSNFKFNVIPRTTFNINWIKSTKFSDAFLEVYANLFFDMAYVDDIYTNKLNPLANQMLWSTGIGLDMITYYDLVLRLELSVNKQNNTGFFISFVAPI